MFQPYRMIPLQYPARFYVITSASTFILPKNTEVQYNYINFIHNFKLYVNILLTQEN